MNIRLYLTITPEENKALERLAMLEMRPLKEQARFLIHEGLLSWGTLQDRDPKETPATTTNTTRKGQTP